MKTAISINDDLFQKAEKLSSKLKISRSQLFAQALEYLIGHIENLEVIQKLNEVYGQNKSEPEIITKTGKRKMKKIIGKW